MAVRFCFQCGLDYADEVGECVECGVATVTYPPTPLHRVGGDDDPQIVYEMHGWSYDARAEAEAAMHDAQIVHGWDGPSLVVCEADEDAVDELLAGIDDGADDDESGEALDAVDLGAINDDDAGARRVMEDLFLAADTLSRNAEDLRAEETVRDGAVELADYRKPFGFEENAWASIRSGATVLATMLESEAPLEDISAEARALAMLLRSYL
jgi:hypothetical protein